MGDFVIVLNAGSVRLTGTKPDKKLYQHHTLYPGGIRTRIAKDVLATDPERAIREAVWGMMPKGPLGRRIIKKLKIYRTASTSTRRRSRACSEIKNSMATTACQQKTYATGRRKTAIARVWLTAGEGKFMINDRTRRGLLLAPDRAHGDPPGARRGRAARASTTSSRRSSAAASPRRPARSATASRAR